MSSRIQGIDFDQSYIPVAHADLLGINISIVAVHKLNSRILDASNEFQNTNSPLIKESVSLHHPIIYTALRNITPTFLSIEIIVHFVFESWMGFRGETSLDKNGIDSFIQWSQLLNIIKQQFIMQSTSRSSLMEQCPILQFLLLIFPTLTIRR